MKTDYDKILRDGGTAPERIDAERFHYLLNILPPRDWRGQGTDLECFRVCECVCGDLYTWCVRKDSDYWEFIAPRDMTRYERDRAIAMQTGR